MKNILFVAALFALTGCGKIVSFDNSDLTAGGVPIPGVSPSPLPEVDYPCPPESTRRWEFTQPTGGSVKKMDLLFVMDTSLSIWDEKKKIAKQISSYMAGLPEGADLQIAILPGHGPLSPFSGHLHAAHGNPKVLKTKDLSHAEIQKQLYANLSCLPLDLTPGGGEYLFRSFMRATMTRHLALLKKQGFLRSDAHLTVVFVSDENDICFNPKKNGFSQFPDYVPSTLGDEELGYHLFCSNKKDKERFSPVRIAKRMQELKGAGNFTVGTIAHVEKAKVPDQCLSEDSLGHGYLELVTLNAPRGRTIEITDKDYSSGLQALALVGSQPGLFTRFDLGVLSQPVQSSILVTVDNREVPFSTDVSNEDFVTVVLGLNDAGNPGSKVLVRACMRIPDVSL